MIQQPTARTQLWAYIYSQFVLDGFYHETSSARVLLSFVLLPDIMTLSSCHHTRDMRLAPPYETHFLVPKHLIQDFAPVRTPMLRITFRPVYRDVPKTNETLRKLTKLDAHPDVLLFLITDSDSTVPGVTGEPPSSLSAWRKKCWKNKLVRPFLEREARALGLVIRLSCDVGILKETNYAQCTFNYRTLRDDGAKRR